MKFLRDVLLIKKAGVRVKQENVIYIMYQMQLQRGTDWFAKFFGREIPMKGWTGNGHRQTCYG